MLDTIKQDKKVLRSSMRRLRDSISKEERERLSAMLNHKLIAKYESEGFKTVHTFIPMDAEINIIPSIEFLLQQGVTVVAPKTYKNRKLEHLQLFSIDQLDEGLYGTKHPSSGQVYTGDYDCIFVPGLAFNQQLQRLGYGGGYYDSFLSNQATAKKIGLCFPFQITSSIPMEPHDILLDEVIF